MNRIIEIRNTVYHEDGGATYTYAMSTGATFTITKSPDEMMQLALGSSVPRATSFLKAKR